MGQSQMKMWNVKKYGDTGVAKTQHTPLLLMNRSTVDLRCLWLSTSNLVCIKRMSAQKVENLNLLQDRQYQSFQMFDLKASLNRSVKTKTFQGHSLRSYNFC